MTVAPSDDNIEKDMRRAERRKQTHNIIVKQKKIAERYGHLDTSQPHRYAKRHAMDCGNPKCKVCGNPRKITKEKTIQEKRHADDIIHWFG